MRQLFSRNARPSIPYRKFHPRIALTNGNLNLPLKSKLESVRQQVEDNLFPQLAVHINRLVNSGAVDNEVEACPVHGGMKDTRKFSCQLGKIGWLVGSLKTSSFNPGEIQECIDELKQTE